MTRSFIEGRTVQLFPGFPTLLLAVVVAIAGCKKSPESKPDNGSAPGSGTAAAKPEPPKLTPEAKLARYQECVAAFNAGKADVIAGCYAKDAIREQVDSVPELMAQGAEPIAEMVTLQKTGFPDLKVDPRVVVVSGNTIAAILHVTGTNSADAGGMKATGKKLGVYEAQIATLNEDGTFARDSFYVDQPTIFHQLGLLTNDTSPTAIPAPTGQPELLISKNDAQETANKAIVQKVLDSVTAKDAAAIDAAAADDIKFTYHGEKAKVETKKAYAKWMKDMLNTTDEGKVEVSGIWAAGDVVVVTDLFTGVPAKEVGADGRTIKTHVVQLFRVVGGKVAQHQIFANRLNTAVQLGFVDPEALMQQLAAAAQK